MEYEIIEINELKYAEQIKDLFKELYWAKDRKTDEIEHQIKNSINVGIVYNKELIAYARAITDYKFISTILDVVVSKEYRGKGLGAKVIIALLEHPKLKNVVQHELYCKDNNIEFYKKLGFELKEELNFMRLNRHS
jgi:ribosomal protein S18 acetylase RimI-like enzyme